MSLDGGKTWRFGGYVTGGEPTPAGADSRLGVNARGTFYPTFRGSEIHFVRNYPDEL